MDKQSYQKLTVWQKAIDLVTEIYHVTEKFPREELYGLTSQMRRAAVSIPSNIAEGSRRSSLKDYRNYIINAFSSGAELETQLLIARRLKYGNDSDFSSAANLLEQVMKMLNKLRSGLG